MRPGDIYHPDFEEGLCTYFDISVRNTLQPTYVVRAANICGIAAEAGEQEKDSLYLDSVSRAGAMFHPLVVETLGAWNPNSLKILKSIARRTTFNNLLLSQAVTCLHQQLSVRLWLYNGKMILGRLALDCSDNIVTL